MQTIRAQARAQVIRLINPNTYRDYDNSDEETNPAILMLTISLMDIMIFGYYDYE
jgi:hypothetical protein